MTLMTSLDDMAILVAVVKAGGFSAAARALGVSKQGLSDRVVALEAELGVRLLHRTTRSVRPTEAGARYVEQCQAIVSIAEEANAGVRNAQVEPTGLLRVASTVSFGHAYLVDVVAEYLRVWPKTRVELVLADRPVSLAEEGFDVAFWIESPRDESLVARPLGQALAYYAASPSYVANHGVPETLADVATARTVGWATETWALEGQKPIRIEPHLVVNSAQAALQAALLGVGVARLPGVLVGSHVADGSLRLLFEGRPARTTTMCVVYSGRFVPAKTRRFLELVTKRIKPMPSLEAIARGSRARASVRSARTARQKHAD
jgi:DNA-binding transcriptional LysR family regulator